MDQETPSENISLNDVKARSRREQIIQEEPVQDFEPDWQQPEEQELEQHPSSEQQDDLLDIPAFLRNRNKRSRNF